ncbi:MAG TPA: hypothetical protein VFU74_13465 [Actinocrinis sp.]|nr:hypothetical protein [Actinocrinis sp.]
MPERLPNELFASWFLRSGWSKGEVARLVNRRARDLGATHVATDTSRVRRWLDGEQPRDPIPRILTELFSERFGCVVTLSDLGLREPASPIAGTLTDLPWSAERTAELLAEFCRSDLILGRRGAGGAPPLAAGSALVEPVKRWLLPAPMVRTMGPAGGVGALAPMGALAMSGAAGAAGLGAPGAGTAAPGTAPALNGRTSAVGVGVGLTGRPRLNRTAILVEQLEETARTFREWDAAVGGGIRRAAVVGQLYEVAEVLRQLRESAPARESGQPRLFRIAAQLALLAGEMALDSGLQATAQRYQILGLHCAKEAGDRSLAAGILAAMGRQLIHLNRAQDALDLLAVGRAGARGELEPLACALIDAVEARAHGALGRAEQCRDAAARALASHELGRAQDHTPEWLAGYTAAALHAELGQALRDLAERVPAAATEASAEFEAAVLLYEREGAAQLRGHVTALVGFADARALLADAAAAADALRTACLLAVRLRSRQTEERLREVLARARQRFPQEPGLRELTERLREPASAAGGFPIPVAALPLQAFTRS